MNNPQKVSFGQMVTNLFKADTHSFELSAGACMHAAVGIMGEVVELLYCTDENHFIEEAGDLEFYIEAMLQVIGFTPEDRLNFDAHRDMVNHSQSEVYIPDTLIVSASEILDSVKKAWVYHKPMDGGLRSGIAASLGTLCGGLQRLYRTEGYDLATILEANQEKLAKRYPDGVYSNQHAQARLDKQEGETNG